MSIRTNPMKAVPTLLKRLERVKKQADLNDLKSELNKIKDLFSKVKKNEDELLDTLTVVDCYIRNKNIHKLMEKEGDICQKIRNSTQKLLPAGDAEVVASSSETFEDVKINKREEVRRAQPSSPQLEDLEIIKVNYNSLDPSLKSLLVSLFYFPENAALKKNIIFLWWRWGGRGHLYLDPEYGFNGFNELRNYNLIVPHCNGKCPVESKFKINPLLRHKSVRPLLQFYEKRIFGNFQQILASSNYYNSANCLVLGDKKVKLNELGIETTSWRAVFNVGTSYLNFAPKWVAKMKNLRVLQLGRWQDSPSHHIEVGSEDFLKELRDQKYLYYLSLRGISGISKLPPSIVHLKNLQVLDLKACHNLETLPNDISLLQSLVYLNLSQCYLLDRMPNGIEKLLWLEVLKGFVIGSASRTPCRISDIAKLKCLRRLSIHIGSQAVIQDGEFESLKNMKILEHLKISWGVFDRKYSDIHINFPTSLKKLHLEGFPGQQIPEWLKPSKLPNLEKLYITGGKLQSLYHGEYNHQWHVEILRLRYIKHLKVNLTNLQELFPVLRYAEMRKTLNHSYFEWSRDN